MEDVEILNWDPEDVNNEGPTPLATKRQKDQADEDDADINDDEDVPLCLTPGQTHSPELLAWTPPPSTPSRPGSAAPSTPILAEPSSAAALSTNPLQLTSPPLSPMLVAGLPPSKAQYYNLAQQADDEIILASSHDQDGEEDDEDEREDDEAYDESPLPVRKTNGRYVTIGVTGKRWGIRGTPGSSLPSLTEPDSPPTTSIDLEWEPEAGLVRMSRESLGEEEASHTAESNSWVPRSSCSTPNSLEWDFRASTLSLRGATEDESWQHTDMETEQLLHEIEQLAARALADTGHGLQAAPR